MARRSGVEGLIDDLTGKFGEMMEGFRSLSKRINQNLEFINNMKNELEAVKMDVSNLKTKALKGTAAKYEGKVDKY